MNRNFSLKHEFQPQNGDPRRHRRNLIWLIQDGRPCTAERSPYVTPEDFLLEESNSGRRQPKTFVAHFATQPPPLKKISTHQKWKFSRVLPHSLNKINMNQHKLGNISEE